MSRNIKKKFQNLKLSKKMLLVYLTVTCITFAISGTALQASFRIYDRQLYKKSVQELDFFSQQVNDRLNEFERISMEIATDTQIQDQLAYMETIRYISAEYLYEMQNVREMLLNKIVSYPDIKNLIYTDGNQVSITVGTAIKEFDKTKTEKILSEFHDAKGNYRFFAPTEDYPYLLSGRDIREIRNASLDYLGSLIFSSDIESILQTEAENLQAEHSALYVYDNETIIYAEDESDGLALPEAGTGNGYQITEQNGVEMFMCYEQSEKTGWMYVNVFPYSEIFGQTAMVRTIMFGGYAVLFLITAFGLHVLAKLITRPLDRFNESMHIVENGDFEKAKAVLKDEDRQDEVGVLTREFRIMLDKIDALIYENYEKQLLLKDTKYKMLQAQINPHFLYNTLNAINWMIRGGKNSDASRMIMELGKLLRAALAKDLYTTVDDEIQTVVSYMTIQKYRYQKRVEFETEVNGNAGAFMIPRMILQPLIENAIYYGVEKSITVCAIKVSVDETQDEVILAVEDCGPGMSADELEKVRTGTVQPKGHGIGLKNIRDRLKMVYENSIFRIDSRPGEGTCIEIRIQKGEMKTDVQNSDRG